MPHACLPSMNTRGFTLIELMIVIAIIAIIAAIAIPNLLEARIAANEASVIADLRSIHSAQNIYREQDKDGTGTLDYAHNVRKLADHDLFGISGFETIGPIYVRSGYKIGPSSNPVFKSSMFTWSMMGYPEIPAVSGKRYFFIDQTAVIRFTVGWASGNWGGGAVSSWPAIGK